MKTISIILEPYKTYPSQPWTKKKYYVSGSDSIDTVLEFIKTELEQKGNEAKKD